MMKSFYFLSFFLLMLVKVQTSKSMEKESSKKSLIQAYVFHSNNGNRGVCMSSGDLPQHPPRPYADVMKKIIVDKEVNARIHKEISAAAFLAYVQQNPADKQTVANLNLLRSLYEKLKDHGCSYIPNTKCMRLPSYRNNIDRAVRNPSLTDKMEWECSVDAFGNVESFIIDLALSSDRESRAIVAHWIQQAYSYFVKQGSWNDAIGKMGKSDDKILMNKLGKACCGFGAEADDTFGFFLWWVRAPDHLKNNRALLREIFQKGSDKEDNLETRTIMAALQNNPNRFKPAVQKTEYYIALSDTQKKKISKVTKKVYRTIEENLSPFWEKGSAEEGNLTVVQTLRKYHRKEENSFRRKKKKREGQENAPLCVMQ